MKENGRMIKRMVLESICIQMEHSTKVSGKKISFLVMALTIIRMGPPTLDNGLMICKMVMEFLKVLTGQSTMGKSHFNLDISETDSNMERASFHGRMGHGLKVISSKIK